MKVGREPEPAGEGQQQPGHRAGRPRRDPAHLLPFDPPRGAEPQDHADRRRRQAPPVQQDPDDGEHRGDVTRRAGQPERVVDPHLLDRSRSQGAANDGQDEPGHAGDHDQAPATRAQVAVGQQEGGQGDAEPDRGRPAKFRHGHGELGEEGQGPVLAEQLVDPGPQGDGVGPGEAGGPVQPADRVARAPQGQHQPDGGEPEHEEERVQRALDQHGDGEGAVDGQGDQQPGGAAAEGDQPQRPGEHHWFGASSSTSSWPRSGGPRQSPPPPVRQRYGHSGVALGLSQVPVTLGQRSNRFPED